MNKIFATAMAAAVYTVAAPAMAATNIPLKETSPGVYKGVFTKDVQTVGSFTDNYEFVVPTAGMVGASVVTLTFDGSLSLSSVLLNNVKLTVEKLASGQYAATTNIGGVASISNPQKLVISGNSTDNTGSYTGSVTFKSAVPEPATWALMILGFGVVGYAMRRRPSVRFAQAI